MESIQHIFSATLKENKENSNLSQLIQELSFELSRKKIQRLKDEAMIQSRIGELFELYCKVLHDEGLKTPEMVERIIDGLLKAKSAEQEAFLYKTIYEKEQLEKSIFLQKQHIKNSIAETFHTLERHIAHISHDTKEAALFALNDAKLKGVEMLGILKETAEEALITTLEKGSDIKDTTHAITKNLTYQTIQEGHFTKQRLLNISQTILKASMDIADEDVAHAKEILEGAVNGVRDGITKALEKFKNDLRYLPAEEIETLFETDLPLLRKELLKLDEHFIIMLNVLASQSEGISATIIKEMVEEMNSSVAKMKRTANEVKELLSDRIEGLKEEAEKKLESFKKDVNEFEKIASAKVESLKQFEFEGEKAKHVAQEAKKLGFRAWEVAKNMVDGAVKGAKDAIKKDEK
ncbi:DUF6781 family protein [Sulfurospirillum deleyianum]|uniref:Uncharacterized protein n=1 Tax=Sulfurospirillum deleyianum (strain ATCC 51133 / DSM 6946 / 5175) TaxID=525898 RepID=D1B5A9_SULD5|nr:DUF6781 family protein [Sulfurospirillum deleyianum]ACZ13279.1 conserved hypothetical protein [Sulfurospirillum deleyianum DSM 6946]